MRNRTLPYEVVSNTALLGRLDDADTQSVLAALESDLRTAGTNLRSAIRERALYFRVSIIGNCNLRCQFCHNEGGPLSGLLDQSYARAAFAAARDVGFTRVQLTGGEPLLHPQVSDFVRLGGDHFDDVGLTTNGTYLEAKLPALIDAGIGRIHVSLQKETLAPHAEQAWSVPYWLSRVVVLCDRHGVRLRFNLPVAEADLPPAANFLESTRALPFGLNVFSILPTTASADGLGTAYLDRLLALVIREDALRRAAASPGRVTLRGYSQPSGHRCGACRERPRCTEQSRSLRLGVDQVWRPCLASRQWDARLAGPVNVDTVRVMALLALDYQPI
jgi:cyclic pyranopterin phosphate synthase